MKLLVNFEGNSKGLSLIQELQVDIEQDAESLGYITSCLFETAKVLADYCEKANPKYAQRIEKGIKHSVIEKEREDNPHYPFTIFLVRDE